MQIEQLCIIFNSTETALLLAEDPPFSFDLFTERRCKELCSKACDAGMEEMGGEVGTRNECVEQNK